MATITNYEGSTLLSGTSTADTITNSGSKVTIEGGAGDDSIVIEESADNYINGGSGNNIIINGQYFKRGSKNSTLVTGAGNDTLISHGSNSSLVAGAGNDVIANGYYYYESWNYFYSDNPNGDATVSDFNGSNVTIDAGDGDDSINNRGDNVTINAGVGNDSVYNYGSNITINAGGGNDSVYNSSGNVTVDAGLGNDTVYNYGADSSIDAGDGDDSINNRGDNVTINAGAGNDTVYNYSDGTIIINTDGGTLAVDNSGSALITGSNANDLISLGGYSDTSTINGGGGNDTVIANNRSAEVIKYVGGNLLIENYNYDDIIELVNDSITNVTTDGGDLIFNTSSGSITLKNMTNHAITIKDANGETSTQVYGTGYLPKDVMKNYVQSAATSMLNNLDRVNEAIKSSSHFNSLQDVIDQMVSDCRLANNADVFLKDYCGIIKDTADTGAVIGWQNGGLTAKTSETITLEEGDAFYPSSTSFTIRGLTINVPEKSTLTEMEQLVVQGLYSWWAENALKLIEESYGVTFNGQSLVISLLNNNNASAWGHAWYDNDTYGVDINMNKTSFNADDKNGNGLDGLFAHELTHIAQYVSKSRNGMTKYMAEGMGDLTDGGSKSLYIAGNADSLAAYLDINNTFSSDSNVYAAGYLFWRYYMKQTADVYNPNNSYAWTDNASLKGTSEGELMTARGTGLTLDAGAGDDTVTAYGRNEVINAGAGNDTVLISSLASGSMIDAGAGDDTINNQGSKVTVDGGAGNDTIRNYGSDVTVNAGAGNDSIRNWGSNVIIKEGDGVDTLDNYASKVTIDGESGDDYIYNGNDASLVAIEGGTGNDTIRNWGSNVTINGGAGEDSLRNFASRVTLNAGADIDSVYNDDYASLSVLDGGVGDDRFTNRGVGVTLNAGAGNDYVYNSDYASLSVLNGDAGDDYFYNHASNVTINGGTGDDYFYNHASNVTINGGAGTDYIYNHASDVTIDAGAGNDVIYSNANGAETFIYKEGDGNDLLRNFDSSDVIRINASSIATQISGNDFVINVGGKNSGLITLKGAVNTVTDKNIILDTTGKLNTIKNTKNKVKVKGTDGDDSIVSNGSKVTIQSGAGNDTITGSDNGEMYLFASNTGNNVVTNFGKNDSLKCTAGNLKSVKKVGNDAIVSLKGSAYSGTVTLLGAGDYNFKQSGNTLTVQNFNIINNTKNKVKVVGTSDADSIVSSGSKVTIQSGAGNDTITGSDNGEMYLFASNTGNNVVTNFGKNDSLKCTAGNLKSVKKVGNDAIVSLKGSAYSGTVTLLGAGDYNFKQSGNTLTVQNFNIINNTKNKVKVVGTANADSIVSSGSKVTIQSGAGNDTITGSDNGEMYLFASNTGNNFVTNFGKNDSLKCTAGNLKSVKKVGNDAIVSLKGSAYSGTVTLLGAGDYNFKQSGNTLTVQNFNIINNTKNKVKVVGTANADSIVSNGSKVTIQSGAGNDTITGSKNAEMYLFSSSDGNNVITNFSAGDSIKMTAGKTMTYSTVGDDVMVTLQGSKYTGTITLKDAADYTFKQSGNTLTVNSNSSKQLSAPLDEYWFTANETLIDNDELNQIVSNESAVDMPSDMFNDLLKPSTIDIVSPARKRQRK